jgi:hypothetical protein
LKFKIEYIIITLLVVVIFLQRQCSSPGEVTEKITVETKYDTIEKETPVYVPKWNTRTEANIDTFLTPVDSLAILKEFFTLYNYIDTVGTDSVQIVINDSVMTNKIIARQVNYKVIYPTITITKEKTVNNTQYYYDNTALETTAEKIFFKWCKKIIILRFKLYLSKKFITTYKRKKFAKWFFRVNK